MGVGTVVSRLGGVVRGIMLAAALGAVVLADTFSLGNTLPNVVYILIIGGALNAVFIPELVRHMKDDGDEGRGYADRLSPSSAPCCSWLRSPRCSSPRGSSGSTPRTTRPSRPSSRPPSPGSACRRSFFYGVYTMLSQALNARGPSGLRPSPRCSTT